MKIGLETFKLELNGVTMQVQELDLPKYTAFRVVFSSSRSPIVVSLYKDEEGNRLWTSIPEGRKKEAAGLGKLIDEYFENKNK
jgi:hypothetical protein